MRFLFTVLLFFISCKQTEYYNDKKYIAVDTTYVIEGTQITTVKYIRKKDFKNEKEKHENR